MEYTIPTVEITLDDETGIDEIISLFVDINQHGVAVTRFDIVKAMCAESSILKKAFDLIAMKQIRSGDEYYKMKTSDITKVIKQLSFVSKTNDQRSKVDKIWQKLIEVLLFTTTGEHTKPSEILKGFISKKGKVFSSKVDATAIKKVQKRLNSFGNYMQKNLFLIQNWL